MRTHWRKYLLVGLSMLAVAACGSSAKPTDTGNTNTPNVPDMPITDDRIGHTGYGDIEEYATPDARCVESSSGISCWPTNTTTTTIR